MSHHKTLSKADSFFLLAVACTMLSGIAVDLHRFGPAIAGGLFAIGLYMRSAMESANPGKAGDQKVNHNA